MYDAPGMCWSLDHDWDKERKNLLFVKKKLLENISFFSETNLNAESDLHLFSASLISKLQEDLSNISKEECNLKETAKLILEYNKIVDEFMLPQNNLGYVILPFYPSKK